MHSIHRLIRSAATLSALSLMVLSAGCASENTLLSQNVDAYAPGLLEQQENSIPEDPKGDSADVIVPQAEVTTDGPDSLIGKRLRVSGRVEFHTRMHDVPDLYRIVWRGVRNSTSGNPTNIRLQDANHRNAVVLRFENDTLEVLGAEGDESPTAHVSSSDFHDVIIRIQMAGAPFVRVEVTQGGETLVTPLPLGLRNKDFSRLSVIQVDSEDAGDYYLQLLRVTGE